MNRSFDFIRAINEDIQKKTAFIAAWNKVEILTKKDGSDYSIISLSVANADVSCRYARRFIEVVSDDSFVDKIYIDERDENGDYIPYPAAVLKKMISERIEQLTEDIRTLKELTLIVPDAFSLYSTQLASADECVLSHCGGDRTAASYLLGLFRQKFMSDWQEEI